MRVPILIAMAATLALFACTPATVPPSPPPPPAGAWTLHVCTGVSWAGCGSGGTYLYANKQDCLEAQAAMRTGDQPVAESELKRNTVSTCAPSTARDAELAE